MKKEIKIENCNSLAVNWIGKTAVITAEVAETGKDFEINTFWDKEKNEAVHLKYIPKVGHCVKATHKDGTVYLFHVVGDSSDSVHGNWFCNTNQNSVDIDKNFHYLFSVYSFEKITPDELQEEFNKLGYEYDFETNTAKKLRWKPKYGENYYLVKANKKITITRFTELGYDNDLFNSGNCFKTPEQAEKYREYLLKYQEDEE